MKKTYIITRKDNTITTKEYLIPIIQSVDNPDFESFAFDFETCKADTNALCKALDTMTDIIFAFEIKKAHKSNSSAFVGDTINTLRDNADDIKSVIKVALYECFANNETETDVYFLAGFYAFNDYMKANYSHFSFNTLWREYHKAIKENATIQKWFKLSALTESEKDILLCLSYGMTYETISAKARQKVVVNGKRQRCSRATFDKRITRLYDKLNKGLQLMTEQEQEAIGNYANK